MFRTVLILLLLCLPARAEEVVAGLSQNRVSITATFVGSEILIYGAVKREDAIPVDDSLGVIVTVTGPLEPVTVRRKARRYGIWINADAVNVDLAPSFYAVATTEPMQDILSNVEDLRHQISVGQMIRTVGEAGKVDNPEDFNQALIRIREDSGLYQTLTGNVTIDEETLFNTSIALPSNLTEGEYTTRIFLTRQGRVIDAYETAIDVRKVGLERWIYTLAHEKPLIYGLLSLFIAIAAGWGASAVFRLIRT